MSTEQTPDTMIVRDETGRDTSLSDIVKSLMEAVAKYANATADVSNITNQLKVLTDNLEARIAALKTETSPELLSRLTDINKSLDILQQQVGNLNGRGPDPASLPSALAKVEQDIDAILQALRNLPANAPAQSIDWQPLLEQVPDKALFQAQFDQLNQRVVDTGNSLREVPDIIRNFWDSIPTREEMKQSLTSLQTTLTQAASNDKLLLQEDLKKILEAIPTHLPAMLAEVTDSLSENIENGHRLLGESLGEAGTKLEAFRQAVGELGKRVLTANELAPELSPLHNGVGMALEETRKTHAYLATGLADLENNLAQSREKARNEILTRVDEAQKNIQSATTEFHATLASTLKADKRDLLAGQERLEKELAEALRTLQATLEERIAANLGSKLERLESERKRAAEGTDTLLRQMSDDLSDLLRKKDQQIADFGRERKLLEDRLGQIENRYAQLEGTNHGLEAKLANAGTMIAGLQDKIANMESMAAATARDLERERDRNREAIAKIDLLEADIARITKEAGEERTAFEKEKERLDSAIGNMRTELAHLRAMLLPYAPLREALLKCDTFSEVVAKHGLSAPGDDGLFACARALGESLEFPREIYETAHAYKLKNIVPLTAEEKKVYGELNECYRKIWNVDFDVFANPGGQSVLDEFRKTKFDRKEALHMINTAENRSYTQEVYVPILRNREGKINQSARVKNGNN